MLAHLKSEYFHFKRGSFTIKTSQGWDVTVTDSAYLAFAKPWFPFHPYILIGGREALTVPLPSELWLKFYYLLQNVCASTLVSHLFWFSVTPFWPLIKPLVGSKKLTILSKCSENIFFPSHWYSLRRQTDRPWSFLLLQSPPIIFMPSCIGECPCHELL